LRQFILGQTIEERQMRDNDMERRGGMTTTMMAGLAALVVSTFVDCCTGKSAGFSPSSTAGIDAD
jgi:hypothetical protein